MDTKLRIRKVLQHLLAEIGEGDTDSKRIFDGAAELLASFEDEKIIQAIAGKALAKLNEEQ